MEIAVPNGIRQPAWQYLLDFTETHEALVLSMYDNQGAGQDVTVGIGTKLFSEDFIQKNAWVKDMFHDKDDPTKVITVEDVKADFRKAASIPRKGNVNPTTHLISEYEELQLRTTPEKAREWLAVRLAANLATMLQPAAFGGAFAGFRYFPADAQVACLSFSYGRPAWDYPLLKQDIQNWDFDEASRQVWIHGASFEKNVAHQTLFWNAGRVLQQSLDFNKVWSQPPADPSRLPWRVWTESVLDLDSGQTTTAVHDTEVPKPKFGDPVPEAFKKKYPGDFKP
jgi:hypothetical protein